MLVHGIVKTAMETKSAASILIHQRPPIPLGSLDCLEIFFRTVNIQSHGSLGGWDKALD
jgi:hypothetical protein